MALNLRVHNLAATIRILNHRAFEALDKPKVPGDRDLFTVLDIPAGIYLSDGYLENPRTYYLSHHETQESVDAHILFATTYDKTQLPRLIAVFSARNPRALSTLGFDWLNARGHNIDTTWLSVAEVFSLDLS